MEDDKEAKMKKFKENFRENIKRFKEAAKDTMTHAFAAFKEASKAMAESQVYNTAKPKDEDKAKKEDEDNDAFLKNLGLK